jgi:hypothetical protein
MGGDELAEGHSLDLLSLRRVTAGAKTAHCLVQFLYLVNGK